MATKKKEKLGANFSQNPWVLQNTTEILPYGLMAHDTIYTSFIQAWQSCHTYTRQFQYKGRNQKANMAVRNCMLS